MKILKKIIKNIIEVSGDTLIKTGILGVVLFGLFYLWVIGKFEFFFALAIVGITTVIDKIKDSKKSGE